MIFVVESDLILKCSFPRSFMIFRMSGGVQKILEMLIFQSDILLENMDFRYFYPTEIVFLLVRKYFAFTCFSMNIFVELDLILKRSFPGSFAIARVPGGDPKYSGNVKISLEKSDVFPKMWIFDMFRRPK